MARTPSADNAARKVDVEPQRRRLRPGASVEVLPASRSAAPRRNARPWATIASMILHPWQHRFVRVTVEARWRSDDFAAGSTAAGIEDALPSGAGAEDDAAAEHAAVIDRHWAVATMIAAAGLAVVVSILVAPRLRNADLPAYPETSAVVQHGAEVYASSCAGCHGADRKGAVTPAGLGPPPLDATGHAWLHSDATLFRMVKFGITNCLPSAAGQLQMPSFSAQLDDRSIHAVVAFIKSRWPEDQRVVQNAFNDGESDTAETQEAILCAAICQPPTSTVASR